MKCRSVILELSSYLDDALDPVLRADLEEHLNKCQDCRLVVDTTKQTIQIFCNADPVPLPEDTRMRLHEALKQRLQHVRR